MNQQTRRLKLLIVLTFLISGGINLADMERLTALDWFGGDEGRQAVQKYIEFCRAGEFVIK